MHDTIQLSKACQEDPFIQPVFQGVFAADQVPFQKLARLSNWAIIINTDPASRPGQHWVAAMKRNGRCYFFDSYGNDPSVYQRNIWRPFNRCERNTKDYQQTFSTVCGDYCLFFLRLFCLKDFRPDFDHLDQYFDEHRDSENDNLVHNIVHQWFPKILDEELHDQFLTQPVAGSRQRGGLATTLSALSYYANQRCCARE